MSGSPGTPVSYIYLPPTPAITIDQIDGSPSFTGLIAPGSDTSISGLEEGDLSVLLTLSPEEGVLPDGDNGDASAQPADEQNFTTSNLVDTGTQAADGNELYRWTATLPTSTLSDGIYQISAAAAPQIEGYPVSEIGTYVLGTLSAISFQNINAASIDLSISPDTGATRGLFEYLGGNAQTFGSVGAGQLSSDGRYLLFDDGTQEIDLQTRASWQVSSAGTVGTFGAAYTIPAYAGNYFSYTGTITSGNGEYTYGAIAATTPYGLLLPPALFEPTVTNNSTGDVSLLPYFSDYNTTYIGESFYSDLDEEYETDANGIDGVPISVSYNGNVVLTEEALLYSAASTPSNGASDQIIVSYLTPPPTLVALEQSGNIVVIDDSASGTATVSGTSNAIGQQVEVDLNSEGAAVGYANVQPDGTWTATFVDAGLSSSSTLYLSVSSALGTPDEVSGGVVIEQVPDAPVLSLLSSTPTLQLTNNPQPTIAGTGDVGDTVTFIDSSTGATLGTDSTIYANGDFYFSLPAPLSQGVHVIYSYETSSSGVVSHVSNNVTLTIDLTPPTEVVNGLIIADNDLIAVADQLNPSMTITGTLDAPLAAGDVVLVTVDGHQYQATANIGDSSFNLSVPTASGNGTATAIVQDAAGNQTMAYSQSYQLQAANVVTQIKFPAASNFRFAYMPSISDNGQFIAFIGSSYSYPQQGSLVIENQATGTAVTLAATGSLAEHPSISGNGQMVVYSTGFGFVNGQSVTGQIYSLNVATGLSSLISAAFGAPGTTSNGTNENPAISEDGNWAVFDSSSTNLTADSLNSRNNVFETNLNTGAVRLVSVSSNDSAADNSSLLPSVSEDGSVVVYTSLADNLTPQSPSNNTEEIYATSFNSSGNPSTILVSTNAEGIVADSSAFDASISADGRYVVFTSAADNLVPGVALGSQEVYRKDLQTGAVVLVSATASGTPGDNFSDGARISDDGNVVIFTSTSDNLIAGNPGEYQQVLVKNIDTGAVRLASGVGLLGADGSSTSPALSGDGSVVAFQSGASDFFPTSSGPSALASVFTSAPEPLCFLRGTRIATPDGARAVEDLRIGDLVTTLSGGVQPIRWIGTGRQMVPPGRRTAATPVIVRRDAIAPGVPERDLHLTKGHSLYLHGCFIPVEFLVNHRSIIWDDTAREVEYYHIELNSHEVLLAENTPTESYRDEGNRWMFSNANPGWDKPGTPPHAPVLTGGDKVDRIWAELLQRSGERLSVATVEDPDLHLLVNGVRVDGVQQAGRVFAFALPMVLDSVVIASRAAAQDQLGRRRDPRRLGVAISRVEWRGPDASRVVPAPLLADCPGFYGYDAKDGCAWTNGFAPLPREICRAGAWNRLYVHVRHSTLYAASADGAKRAA